MSVLVISRGLPRAPSVAATGPVRMPMPAPVPVPMPMPIPTPTCQSASENGVNAVLSSK